MKLLNTLIILCTMLALTGTAAAQQPDGAQRADSVDWEPVIYAIMQIESGGHLNAVNGPYVGPLQIAPVMVRECNNILRQRGSAKRFQLSDRRSLEKSKEMFLLIMSKYNPQNDIDKACRIWKMGIGYTIKGTQSFVNRVHRIMEERRRAAEAE